MDGWLVKTAFHWFKKAVEDYRLLQDGEKVLISVSGGADSLVLLHLFALYNRKRKKHWQLLACHINPNFPNWKTKPIERIFKTIGLNYAIEDVDMVKELKLRRNAGLKFKPCFICARQRRKRLFEIAQANGIMKIALAHHMEDVIETYLLNLFYASEVSTFLPKQDFFQSKFFIIRPLYFFDKELIRKYLTTYGLRPIKNTCPYAKSSERARIRRFLEKFYALDKRIKTNIFWGIKNIKTQYLPD
jgi:tRNA 2-thiocytidine biosynthesis protein TtcA